MWKSLHIRLVASYFLLSIILLGVTGGVFYAALSEYAVREQRTQIQTRREQAFEYVNQAQGSPSEVLLHLQRLFPDFDVELASGAPAYNTNPGLHVIPITGELETPVRLMLEPDPHAPTFSVRYPADERIAEFRFLQRSTWPGLLRIFSSSVVLIMGVGVGVAALLGWWFSRWLARPIASLSEATAAVAAGNFEQVVAPTGMRELDPLVAQFNQMSQQLRESFRSLGRERDRARRFASDAAHELKTPITALRAYHEIAQSRPDRLEQMLEATGRQIERLERVVRGLIRMATINEGAPLQAVPCDLHDLVRTVEPALRAEAENAGHILVTDVATVQVLGDPDLLLMALTNLVENACKFTPAGGRIEIQVAAAQGEVHLSVRDTGVGISAEEIPHIFERFHRAIDTQGIPGSGLGLALVQEAAGLMGGDVFVESEVGRGSCFTIRLPLCTAA